MLYSYSNIFFLFIIFNISQLIVLYVVLFLHVLLLYEYFCLLIFCQVDRYELSSYVYIGQSMHCICYFVFSYFIRSNLTCFCLFIMQLRVLVCRIVRIYFYYASGIHFSIFIIYFFNEVLRLVLFFHKSNFCKLHRLTYFWCIFSWFLFFT